MQCIKCGKDIPDDSPYCPKCGHIQSEPVMSRIEDVSRHLGKYCAHCGEPLKEYTRFCTRCGKPVEAASTYSAITPAGNQAIKQSGSKTRLATIVAVLTAGVLIIFFFFLKWLSIPQLEILGMPGLFGDNSIGDGYSIFEMFMLMLMDSYFDGYNFGLALLFTSGVSIAFLLCSIFRLFLDDNKKITSTLFGKSSKVTYYRAGMIGMIISCILTFIGVPYINNEINSSYWITISPVPYIAVMIAICSLIFVVKMLSIAFPPPPRSIKNHRKHPRESRYK